jgi:hypothetical protein
VTPVEQAITAARAGDTNQAALIMTALMEAALPHLIPIEVEVRTDQYSLNSLHGFMIDCDGVKSFFKLHVEEGEERTVEEYYRAELLSAAHWPVDQPWFASTTPGEQFLLYRWRDCERMADACRRQELSESTELGDKLFEELVDEQRALDEIISTQMILSLHETTAADVVAEPIHQLFHHRLVDDERQIADGLPRFGGRAKRFYAHSPLLDVRWVVNGIALARTFRELLDESLTVLNPIALSGHGAVTAHGDAHNANVWRTDEGLRVFDPAFAGQHIPALVADTKATFHNVWAHPLWLYDPDLAEKHFHTRAEQIENTIHVQTDWEPGPLRDAFADIKREVVWKPLLIALHQRNLLPPNWERIVRCALFCCPTLVLDLGSRGPQANTLGIAIAMLMGSESVDRIETPTLIDTWIHSISP